MMTNGGTECNEEGRLLTGSLCRVPVSGEEAPCIARRGTRYRVRFDESDARSFRSVRTDREEVGCADSNDAAADNDDVAGIPGFHVFAHFSNTERSSS